MQWLIKSLQVGQEDCSYKMIKMIGSSVFDILCSLEEWLFLCDEMAQLVKVTGHSIFFFVGFPPSVQEFFVI